MKQQYALYCVKWQLEQHDIAKQWWYDKCKHDVRAVVRKEPTAVDVDSEEEDLDGSQGAVYSMVWYLLQSMVLMTSEVNCI